MSYHTGGIGTSMSHYTSNNPSRPGTPSARAPEQDFDFNFTVPPRLKSIGRQLSQMSENFLPPNFDEKPAVKRSPSVHEHKVPFMGDEPVLCPFCSKPLPPSLLATGHQHDNRQDGAKQTGAEAKSKAPSPHPSMIAHDPEELQKCLVEGDLANAAAANLVVSETDLQRWSRHAGLSMEPVRTKVEEVKPVSIPILAPPPSGRQASKSWLAGKSGKKDGDEDESDEDVPTGYAKLDAPGSDEDDDEGDVKPKAKVVHDEPAEILPTPSESASQAGSIPVDLKPESEQSEEVRVVLKEVLAKVDEMSKSHSSLLTSHSSLLTSLKIARSNLSMAEANSEMLEEQLKRGRSSTFSGHAIVSPTPVAVPKMPQTPVTAPPAPEVVPSSVGGGGVVRPMSEISRASVEPKRKSEETKRPLSLAMPPKQPDLSTSPTSANDNKVWGFWNKQKTIGNIMAQIPGTPNSEKSFDFSNFIPSSQIAPYTPAETRTAAQRIIAASEAPGLSRSASFNATSPPNPAPVSEINRLKSANAAARGHIDRMTKELAVLKTGKVEMEAELENLSQALFEEANKMVSDERRKRAEMEELLKEVRDEREALRSTIKVLGGAVPDIQVSEEKKEVDGEDGDEVGDLDLQPRDLDKHYAALRKTIHHVADGTGIPDLSAKTDVDGIGLGTSPSSAAEASLGLASGAGADKDGASDVSLSPSVAFQSTSLSSEYTLSPRMGTTSISTITTPSQNQRTSKAFAEYTLGGPALSIPTRSIPIPSPAGNNPWADPDPSPSMSGEFGLALNTHANAVGSGKHEDRDGEEGGDGEEGLVEMKKKKMLGRA